MMPINKPNHPNLTAPIPKFSILSATSPPAAMEYKNAPTITIQNAGASKNIPKSEMQNFKKHVAHLTKEIHQIKTLLKKDNSIALSNFHINKKQFN